MPNVNINTPSTPIVVSSFLSTINELIINKTPTIISINPSTMLSPAMPVEREQQNNIPIIISNAATTKDFNWSIPKFFIIKLLLMYSLYLY
jgi:hypothetical protein